MKRSCGGKFTVDAADGVRLALHCVPASPPSAMEVILTNGCRQLAHAFGGGDVTFRECGIATGFEENYTHERLILSKPASREIWPMLACWMKERL